MRKESLRSEGEGAAARDRRRGGDSHPQTNICREDDHGSWPRSLAAARAVPCRPEYGPKGRRSENTTAASTAPSYRGPRPRGLTIVIESVEGGVVKGIATRMEGKCRGDIPVAGKLEGNKVHLRETEKAGRRLRLQREHDGRCWSLVSQLPG
ncbi:MAG: hypothetical protein MZU91_10295 [Desulfosudis oleivorans]|nr:hypothetical protein [Desulfosudis oleivorans]